jgi:hypothetical protein
VSGFALGQPLGHGRTEQTTIVPGTAGAPVAPAAGATYTYTLTRYDRARLVFAAVTLATDANVANRYLTIEYLDGAGVAIVADGAAVTVSASTTAQRFVGVLRRGTSEWATNTDVFFPLCGVWIEAGQRVKVSVANIQATDQLSNIRLTFDRLIPHDASINEKHAREREADEQAR